MKLPSQSIPVARRRLVGPSGEAGAIGIGPSRKKCITGLAKCTRRGSVLFTGDATICAENNHDNCTAAKDSAVASILAACQAEGGIASHSGSPCTIGDNCSSASDCV